RGRQGLRGGDAGRGAAGGAAGVRPRLEPVGRGRLAAPQARRVAQPDVPGPGGVAPGAPLGHRPPPTDAAPRSILLCTSRVEAETYLTAFAQRSVKVVPVTIESGWLFGSNVPIAGGPSAEGSTVTSRPPEARK